MKEKHLSTGSNYLIPFEWAGIIFLLCFFINTVWISDSNASTINASSCALSDVNNAIDSASAGDTVLIPSGACTWGANGSYVNVNKAITLVGEGQGKTIITLSDSGGKYGSGTIRISAPATVMNMTVNGSNSNPVTAFSASTSNGWRIANIEYNGGTSGAYFAYIGSVYGLIDHNTITGGVGNAELIFARGPSDSWQTANSLGTADNLFIEDNTFSGQGYVCDINSNGRAVLRYNTITGKMKIDGHGKASNTPPRGVREMEVYRNSWVYNVYGTGSWMSIQLRGGTGIVFDNSVDTNNPNGAILELTDYGYTAQWGNFNNEYQCPSNYPVDDQIGVGEDPKTAASEPMYLWNNIRNSENWTVSLASIPSAAKTYCNATYGDGTSYTMAKVISANRDYYKGGIVVQTDSSTPFDGTSGVGVGTLANRPTTCTTGVGYWATDQGNWNQSGSGGQGILYKCTSTNTWKEYYEPYTYPNPLSRPKAPLLSIQ